MTGETGFEAMTDLNTYCNTYFNSNVMQSQHKNKLESERKNLKDPNIIIYQLLYNIQERLRKDEPPEHE